MKALLDTHTLIWWAQSKNRLPLQVSNFIARTPEVYASAASAWEIATKYRLGRLATAEMLVLDFAGEISKDGFRPLAITVSHASAAGSFPALHGDPFDRLLAAQAIAEECVLVSADTTLDAFGVVRYWA